VSSSRAEVQRPQRFQSISPILCVFCASAQYFSSVVRGDAFAAIQVNFVVNERIEIPADLRPKNRQQRRAEITIPKLFQLVIECRDENQQRELYERLTASGHVCKVMTL
jgi:hypothetical protein